MLLINIAQIVLWFRLEKDSCTYVSRSTAKISRQADVSLIAHKNNDASDMNYSNINDEEENEENEKEEDNKEENGKENNGEHQNKKRRISRKEVFIGEDKTPIVVEEDQKDNENEKKKDKGKKMIIKVMVLNQEDLVVLATL